MRYSWFSRSAVLCAMTAFLAVGSAFALDKLQPTSKAAASQLVEFNVYLPLQHVTELDQFLADVHDPKSANYHKWLTPAAFRARFGADQGDLARVSRALQGYGLAVMSSNSQGLHVTGRIASVEAALGTSIWNGTTPSGKKGLVAATPLALPSALTSAGAMIPRFSPTIWHHTHSHKVAAVAGNQPQNRYGGYGPYWFTDLKQAYDWPSVEALSGKGATIGIIMSSDYSDLDMQLYFGHEGLAVPKIIRRPVLGGAPFDPEHNGSTPEVSLDLQQAGGAAPGATLVLYNIPDLSDASVLAGYLSIIEENAADVVSSSFGAPELGFTPEYNDGVDYTWITKIYDQLFKQGNAQGITFVASSGDEGGLGIPSVDYFTTPPQNPPVVVGHFVASADHPASSPYVTAVGGTNLETTIDPPTGLQSQYVRENAFGDLLLPFDPYGTGNLADGGYWGSGGGKSIFYKKPAYQKLVNTGAPVRTVPDVSLQMGGCPVGAVEPCSPERSFVIAVIGGGAFGLIGTSASAPEFAGLLALEVEHLGGRLGNENFDIYSMAAQQNAGALSHKVYHTNIPGFDGIYSTKPGYDYVVGNGTVYGKYFIHAPNVPSAGDPQTSTNP